MARGKSLLSLLQDFRAETGASSNVAHNTSARERQVYMLQRTQELLWEEYDWPHMRVTRFIDLQAGQRYYSPPSDMILDRTESVEVRYGQAWVPLADGINAEQYSIWASELDERSWPVERWAPYEDSMFEVWPVPADNADVVSLDGRLKITGIRNLNPLVADDDVADLDNRMVVLFAAAEEQARAGKPDAPLKLQAAEKRKAALIQNFSKITAFKMFGGTGGRGWQPKGPPRVHYRVNETP